MNIRIPTGTSLDMAGLLASSLDATGSAAAPGVYRNGREAVAGAMANLLFSDEFRPRFALPTPPRASRARRTQCARCAAS